MDEDGFQSNFAWYEWSFVSPEQMPVDDRQVAQMAIDPEDSPLFWPVDRSSGERPWR